MNKINTKRSFILKRNISFTSTYSVHNKQPKNDSIFTRTLETECPTVISIDNKDKDL